MHVNIQKFKKKFIVYSSFSKKHVCLFINICIKNTNVNLSNRFEKRKFLIVLTVRQCLPSLLKYIHANVVQLSRSK